MTEERESEKFARIKEENKNNPNLDGLFEPDYCFTYSGYDRAEDAIIDYLKEQELDMDYIILKMLP